MNCKDTFNWLPVRSIKGELEDLLAITGVERIMEEQKEPELKGLMPLLQLQIGSLTTKDMAPNGFVNNWTTPQL